MLNILNIYMHFTTYELQFFPNSFLVHKQMLQTILNQTCVHVLATR